MAAPAIFSSGASTTNIGHIHGRVVLLDEFTIFQLMFAEQSRLLAENHALQKSHDAIAAKYDELLSKREKLKSHDYLAIEQTDSALEWASFECIRTMSLLEKNQQRLNVQLETLERQINRVVPQSSLPQFQAIFLLLIQYDYFSSAETAFSLWVPKPLPIREILESLLETVLRESEAKPQCFRSVKICEMLARQNLDTSFTRASHAACLVALGSRYSLEAARNIVLGRDVEPNRTPLGIGEVVEQARNYANYSGNSYKPSLAVIFNNLSVQMERGFPGAAIEGFLETPLAQPRMAALRSHHSKRIVE